MNIKEIHELEAKHRKLEIEYKMSEARYKNREQAINAGINIIALQMRYQTLAMLYRGLNDQ